MPYPYPVMPNLKNNFSFGGGGSQAPASAWSAPNFGTQSYTGGPMTSKAPPTFNPMPVTQANPTDTGIPPQGGPGGVGQHGNNGQSPGQAQADFAHQNQQWKQANMGPWSAYAQAQAKWLGMDPMGNPTGQGGVGPAPIDPRVGQGWFDSYNAGKK